MKDLLFKLKNNIHIILPLAFFSNGIISGILLLVALPYFQDHETVRVAISLIFCIILWGILLFNVLRNINRHGRMEILLILLMIMIILAVFAAALFSSDFDSSIIVMTGRFGVFSLSYVFAAVILVRDECYREFISCFKWYGAALIPFVVFYIARMLQVQTEPNQFINIAGFSYMSVADTLAPILICCMADIIIHREDRYKYVNWAVIVLFWVAILYSGTKGTIVSVVWSVIILGLLFVRKNTREINILVLKQICLVAVIFAFTSLVWAPVSSAYGDSGRLADMSKVIENEVGGFFSGSDQGEAERDNPLFLNNIIIEEIIKNPGTSEATIKEIKEGIINGEIYQAEVDSGKILLEDVKNFELITSRAILFRLSIGEIKKNPLTGNGPMHFQQKYGVYPHNWGLEMLCDFGVVVTAVIFLGIVFLFICVLRKMHRISDVNSIKAIVLLCLSFIPKYVVSGSMYLNGTLLFTIVFGILFLLKNSIDESDIQKTTVS